MGPFSSQVGHGLGPGGTRHAPAWVWCPRVGQGDTGAGGLPLPIAPPCLLLQFPVEDGTYGITLPPELFGEDAAAGAGGEEGSLGWLRGAGTPRSLIPTRSLSRLSAAGAVVEASARSVASPYTFLVAGGSLLLGIALFIGIVVR